MCVYAFARVYVGQGRGVGEGGDEGDQVHVGVYPVAYKEPIACKESPSVCLSGKDP